MSEETENVYEHYAEVTARAEEERQRWMKAREEYVVGEPKNVIGPDQYYDIASRVLAGLVANPNVYDTPGNDNRHLAEKAFEIAFDFAVKAQMRADGVVEAKAEAAVAAKADEDEDG